MSSTEDTTPLYLSAEQPTSQKSEAEIQSDFAAIDELFEDEPEPVED